MRRTRSWAAVIAPDFGWRTVAPRMPGTENDSVTRPNPSSNDPSGSEPNQSCSRVRRTASAGSPAKIGDVSNVAADYMVDQITDTPLVTRGAASPVITLNFHETLSKPAARAFERFCAIHDGLPGPRRAP